MSLVEKYRPETFADIVGNDGKVGVMKKFCANPSPSAWLLTGASGIGKTSLAHVVANELNPNAFNGLGKIEIQSGDCTAATISELWNRLAYSPGGSGWVTVIINEADAMTQGAAVKLLDALEKIPAKTCVILTSNDTANMPDRLLSRMKVLFFTAQGMAEAGAKRLESIYKAEGGNNGYKPLNAMRAAKNNLRAAIQELEIELLEHS